MSSAFSVVASEVVVFVKMWTLWKYDNNPQPPLHSTLLHSPAPDSTTKHHKRCLRERPSSVRAGVTEGRADKKPSIPRKACSQSHADLLILYGLRKDA